MATTPCIKAKAFSPSNSLLRAFGKELHEMPTIFFPRYFFPMSLGKISLAFLIHLVAVLEINTRIPRHN